MYAVPHPSESHRRDTRRRTQGSTKTGPRKHGLRIQCRTTLRVMSTSQWRILIIPNLALQAPLCRFQAQVVQQHPCSTQMMTVTRREELLTMLVRYLSVQTWQGMPCAPAHQRAAIMGVDQSSERLG